MSNKEAFLQAFEAATQPVAGSAKARMLGSVSMEIEGIHWADDRVYLADIKSETPGQGSGTGAMQFLTSLADKHNVYVYLDAEPDTAHPHALRRGDLIDFYRKHGFVKRHDTEMLREPQEQPVSKPPVLTL